MCYGKLPQHLLDEYQFSTCKVLDTYQSAFEPLKKSLKNAIPKYNKTRDPASQASVSLMRPKTVAVHPCLTSLIDDKEEALIAFKADLGKFKPKQSVLEIKIARENDADKISSFRAILDS